jgi:rhodanese-related sulfurtransferase
MIQPLRGQGRTQNEKTESSLHFGYLSSVSRNFLAYQGPAQPLPDKSAAMVLYCGGGYRSALVAEALGKMGYQNAISLDGGWRAWNEAGLPVEK